MSYDVHPAYRPANTGWMADIPACWATVELKWVASRYAGGTPDRNRLDYWEDGTIPWVNSGAVNQQPVADPSTFITDEALANSSARWVPEGALVIALAGQGKTKAMVSQMAIDATCNQSMAAIVPNDRIDARFLYWWLTANYQNIRNMGGGDNRDGINLEMLGAIQCPLPPLAEQLTISVFLDRETAHIDALIGKQERLVDVLGERRSAMITHAVTRGLDPGAPLKDSGVVWLGEVAAAWTVLGLGHVIDTLAGFSFGSASFSTDPNDVRLLRGANVSPGSMNWADVVYWPESETAGLDAYWLEAGDLVLGLDRPIISTGIRVACIEPDDVPALLLQRVCRIRATDRADQHYLAYVLGSVLFRYYLEPIFTGVSVPHMSEGQLRDFRVALPALDEQLKIVAHLDRETAKIDALVEKAKAMNVVLRERRSALISAAVTGKIDVTKRIEGRPDGAVQRG